MRAVLTAKKGPKHLQKAIAKDPNRLDALLALGVYHYVADTTPKSLAPFKALLGIKGNRTQGLKELQKATTAPHPFQYDAIVALFYINYEYEKNYPKALDYVNQLEKKFPENPKWQTLKAEIFEKQDKVKGMRGYMDVIAWCQAKPNRCSPKFLFAGYFQGGRIAMELGQKKGAKELLAKALAVAPKTENNNRARALLMLAEIEQEAGNASLALEKYRQAKKIKGIKKDQRRKIEDSIKKLCQADQPPAKC